MEERNRKTMDKEQEKIIKETTSRLLDLLGVDGEVDYTINKETVDIVLDTKDSGVVIGYHGETLEALQLIISLCISKKIDSFVRVSVEVGDYKKNRTSWLETLAIQAKERALQEGTEVPLTNLKSWERRVVHLILQDDPDVSSESVGQGRDRTLIIKPR